MTKVHAIIDVPEGMRLGNSKDSEGAKRGLLFDDTSNKLVRHAEIDVVGEAAGAPDRAGAPLTPRSGTRDTRGTLDKVRTVIEVLELALVIAPLAVRLYEEIGVPAVSAAKAKLQARRAAKRGAPSTEAEEAQPEAVASVVAEVAPSDLTSTIEALTPDAVDAAIRELLDADGTPSQS